MEVKEVQDMAAGLETEIAKLIRDFQLKTGCKVDSVELNQFYLMNESSPLAPFVKCKIELR